MMIVGVDISKATMDEAGLTPKGAITKKSPNSPRGADELYKWACTQQQRHNLGDDAPLFAMEATGAYHFLMAVILRALGARVAVIPPQVVAAFREVLMKTSKSDPGDAVVIAMCAQSLLSLGQLREFTPPPDALLELKALMKRLVDLTGHIAKERIALKEHQRYVCWLGVSASLLRAIAWLEAEKEALQDEIENFYKVAAHASLKEDRELLFTIPGVGPQAADHLICLVRSRENVTPRQAAALAGVVPRNKDSGTSVHAPAHITKEGDARVRAGLYLPTMSAVQTDAFRDFYEGHIASGKSKKSSTIISLAKLVRTSTGMLRNRTPFDAARVRARAKALPRATAHRRAA